MKIFRSAGMVALTLALGAWRVHPIHAARIEIDATVAGVVSAVVHVYRDDFPPGIKLAEVAGYLDHVLVVSDAAGKRVALHPSAIEPEGDRLKISLSGTSSTRLSGGRIALTMLQEKFADQVNVVDARIGGRRAQMVFLRGDGSQALP